MDPQVPAALAIVVAAAAGLAWHQANSLGLWPRRHAPGAPAAPSKCSGCAFAKDCSSRES